MDRAPLDVVRLRTLLGDRWRSVEVVASTGSTNADLLAADGADRSLLVAEVQTAGRGRFERVWSSPSGVGLTFSVLVRPSAPVAAWGWLPLLAGTALAQAVRGTTGVEAVLKWPNDLLAPDGRKLAGILAQAGDGAAVVGIGLNVSTAADELPLDTATSLALAGAADPDRTALLAAIAGSLDGWVERWEAAGGDAESCGLARAYRELCSTLGRQVRVSRAAGGVLTGVADAVQADGRLRVTASDGHHLLAAGDVEHLRPA